MNPAPADRVLLESLEHLVSGKGMLTGAAVCYGGPDAHFGVSFGLRQEVLYENGGFVPAPLPITNSTIYDLASLTKLFTLVSVLQLVERGRLRPGDSIAWLDPRFPNLADCSLIDCLSYRASLQTPQRVDRQADARTARDMVFRTRLAPLQGERLYSDMNALVLKYVVEAVSGQGFMDYLGEHVLGPAGMRETWTAVPENRLADVMNYNYEHTYQQGEFTVSTAVPPGQPHDPKARLLRQGAGKMSGHAGLFATANDVCLFARALLRGELISRETLLDIGVNRTGYLRGDGAYRQYLGLLCFSKSPVQRLSEVPAWMGKRAFALSGYTGNHLAIDPELGVFDLLLGNRCHNRLARVIPAEAAGGLGLAQDGAGMISWPDGRQVRSSFGYIYQKDRLVHAPAAACLRARGLMP